MDTNKKIILSVVVIVVIVIAVIAAYYITGVPKHKRAFCHRDRRLKAKSP